MSQTEIREKYLHLALQNRQQGECPATLAQKMLDFVYPSMNIAYPEEFSVLDIVENKVRGRIPSSTIIDECTDEGVKAVENGWQKSGRGWRKKADESWVAFKAEKNADIKPKKKAEPQGRKFKGFDTPAGAIPTPENTGLAAGQLSVLVTICDLMDRAKDSDGIKGGHVAERMDVPHANIFDSLEALIRKGYLRSEGDLRAKRYFALKRPDGSDYKPCEFTIEDGIRITRCPPRPATDGVGFMEFGS